MILKFSFSITWEFVRNTHSLAQGKTYQIRNSRNSVLTLTPCDSDLHWILRTMSFSWFSKAPWTMVRSLKALCSSLLQTALETSLLPTGQWHLAGQELRLDMKKLRVILPLFSASIPYSSAPCAPIHKCNQIVLKWLLTFCLLTPEIPSARRKAFGSTIGLIFSCTSMLVIY